MASDVRFSLHGGPITSYDGEGVLTVEGGRALPCEFTAAQLRDGEVVLECRVPGFFGLEDAVAFSGKTSDDAFLVESRKGFLAARAETSHDGQGLSTAITFLVDEIEAVAGGGGPAVTARYGLTNFEFAGTEPTPAGHRVLPLELGGRRVVIEPLADYSAIRRRLGAFKSVEVTCESVVGLAGDENPEQI